MKILQSVVETEGEGLEALLGENVLLLCSNYFYKGKLVGVNTTCVKLEEPSIIYETGAWANKSYQDEQRMGMRELYVQVSHIESFGLSK